MCLPVSIQLLQYYAFKVEDVCLRHLRLIPFLNYYTIVPNRYIAITKYDIFRGPGDADISYFLFRKVPWRTACFAIQYTARQLYSYVVGYYYKLPFKMKLLSYSERFDQGKGKCGTKNLKVTLQRVYKTEYCDIHVNDRYKILI